MFDSKTEFAIDVPGPAEKKPLVGWPSDKQWCEWRRKKKIVQKDIGRGYYQIQPSEAHQIDLDTFNAIRIKKDGEPEVEIDIDEAEYVIGRLAMCETTESPEREGNTYRIKIRVMDSIDTVHVLRIPTMKESKDYGRSRPPLIQGPYGTHEIRIDYHGAGKLYDTVKVSAEGYAGDVPIIHKVEAVNVLLQEMNSQAAGVPGE